MVKLGAFIPIIAIFFWLGFEVSKSMKWNEKTLLEAGYNFIENKTNITYLSASRNSGITLTNNEKKDIIKVTRSLENRGILLKGTTRKVNSQKRRLLNFLAP